MPKETDRLRKQLEKAKDSRKVMAQQHDDTLAALERAKEVYIFAFTVQGYVDLEEVPARTDSTTYQMR